MMNEDAKTRNTCSDTMVSDRTNGRLSFEMDTMWMASDTKVII